MTRSVSLYLILSLFFIGGLGSPQASAGSEPEQVTLLANEEYVGAIDHKSTRYLQVTLTNLAEEASTCRIAFYQERIELSAERVGPVEFRTFTLERKNDTQTRTWTTLNFDEFTLNVETGNIQIIVEKTMYTK
ncbi:MAG: hypothetical protein GY697_06270 [Desulfobacterales bacterium]|nr:hypothetical protein [Desulfobacterales bacterium]